nr:hypothetical protein [Desulfobacterales bacterium]
RLNGRFAFGNHIFASQGKRRGTVTEPRFIKLSGARFQAIRHTKQNLFFSSTIADGIERNDQSGCGGFLPVGKGQCCGGRKEAIQYMIIACCETVTHGSQLPSLRCYHPSSTWSVAQGHHHEGECKPTHISENCHAE